MSPLPNHDPAGPGPRGSATRPGAGPAGAPRPGPRAGAGDPPPSPWATEARGLGGAWHSMSVLMSGLLMFGVPAWFIGRALDQGWVFPVGLVVGMGAGIGAVWVRYGVQR